MVSPKGSQMKAIVRFWRKYYYWLASLSPWEASVLILLLLILFSVWLIFDVSK